MNNFFLILVAVFLSQQVAFAEPVSPPSLTAVKIPNDINYWQTNGFAPMEGLLELPTNFAKTDHIRVWLKIPDGGKLSVLKLTSQKYSLVYPAGTVADRVESTDDAIDDVRGARIDDEGHTIFHDYELVPGESTQWLSGYEWMRSDNLADQQAGEALIKLFFNSSQNWNPNVIKQFATLNQCGACHTPNIEPAAVNPDIDYASDTRGFFQIMTALENEIVVRNHRRWDLNADNQFVTVWCGSQQTHAIVKGNARGYVCPNDVAPTGRLDVIKGMAQNDSHTRQLCASRRYLFQHMDDLARSAYETQFQECGIR